MTGDVGHEHAQPLRIDGNELVEIASHSGHGAVGGRDAKSWHPRDAFGKDGRLNAARSFQFALHR